MSVRFDYCSKCGTGDPPGWLCEACAVAPPDPVARPDHYTAHPSGVECITITEYFSFNVGNAIKYLWRAGLKGDRLEDLKKARWYIDREILRSGGVK